MSNYNSMSGEYRLTASDVSKVHTQLRRYLKENQTRLYDDVIKAYEKLGGKPVLEKFYKHEYDFTSYPGFFSTRDQLDRLDRSVCFVLRKFGGKKPTKAQVVKPYTSKSTSFSNEDGSIYFRDNTIRVEVGENNRAVERFCETLEWSGLVVALRSLKWSRKDCGGCLWYLDEYMRESDYVESSPVHCFGHLGKQR